MKTVISLNLEGSTMLYSMLPCILVLTAISNTVTAAYIGDIIPCNMSRTWYSAEEWKYLTLTMSWPQTFCLTQDFKDCRIPQNVHNWTIHGLWPSSDSGEGPSYCGKKPFFDSSKVKGLLNGLNKFWPDLIDVGSYYAFWSHEWCRHGTCANSVPSLKGETNYFNKTLQLFQNFNPYSTLSRAGITPSDSKTYPKKDIMNALTTAFSFNISIGCYRQNDSSIDYLHEVYVCMDKSFHLIDCPDRENATCSDSVTYPTIHHDSVAVQNIS